MKSDSDIRKDVIRELDWNPQVSDPEAIGVAVEDGAVTLTGRDHHPGVVPGQPGPRHRRDRRRSQDRQPHQSCT
jgi:hypothetical protein